MTVKSFGSGLSGYLDPDGRAWETAVFIASKPVLDKELNLTQDIEQGVELGLRRRSMPSGFIADDFTNTSDMTSGVFTVSAVANQLILPQDLRAHVNGWLVRVGNTGGTGTNLVSLGAGPAGAGARRTDLVILEVWRRLILPSPSIVGKSPAARIWRDGNVKVASGDDVALNYADDILDGTLGVESTRRVQIQFRLRVITNVDIQALPFGIDDPVVVARSVPTNAATPDGAATLFTYANQSSAGDPGLWVAGDGNPANTIGSVDGYMYALPVCAVVRRNTTAFARNTNHNGGVASPGPSDRPDGLFHDIIVARDIIDLRMGVSPSGWDYQELMSRNFNWLLDNVIRTETTLTTIGAGTLGNTVLWADEIGISNANGGDGTTTGDTPGAEFVGEFDAVRRRFSDRATIETVTLVYNPAGASWVNDETVTIDLSALPIYPYTAFNWAAYAPSGVVVVDMPRAMYLGVGNTKRKANIGADFYLTGTGTVPATSLTLSVGTVPGAITNEPLYVTLAIMYPPGVGLSKTPTADYGSSSVVLNNPGQMPAGAPVLYEAIVDRSFDNPHRELFLTYRTVSQTISFSWGTGLNDTLHFPERVTSISAISINGSPYAGGIVISDDGYSAQLDAASFTTGEATVTFKAIRPFPQNDEQVTVYYETRAPQTVRDALLAGSLSVIPRHISQQLFTLTVGSGSQDEAYPFPSQYVQQPGVYPTSGGTFSGDHQFEGSGAIFLENFSVNTGYVQLPVTIGYVTNPQEATYNRTGGDVDAEGRSYFKSVPGGAYVPNSFAQPLKVGSKTRRTLLPMLAELSADTSFGKKGQLVLVVFGAYYASATAESWNNAIDFNTNLAANITSVSVYKIKGNLLNRRSV